MIMYVVITAYCDNDFVDIEEIVGPFLTEVRAKAYAGRHINRRVVPLTPDPAAGKVLARRKATEAP